MPRLRWLARALPLLLAGEIFGAAVVESQAQVLPGAPQDMLRPRTPVDGRVRFCINANSILAEFDRQVASLLADQLLVTSDVHAIVTADPPLPLDYRFIQAEVDLFVEFTNQCDALLGYPLPASGPLPDWLTVTRPYFTPPVVLAMRPDAPPLDSMLTIGSVIGTAADGQSRAYGRAQSNWKRRVFSSYERMIEDVQSGKVDGILIWEPALLVGLGTDIDVSTLTIATPPMPVPRLELSIALPSNSAYLRTQLDTAIASALDNGLIDDLAVSMGLSARSSSP